MSYEEEQIKYANELKRIDNELIELRRALHRANLPHRFESILYHH